MDWGLDSFARDELGRNGIWTYFHALSKGVDDLVCLEVVVDEYFTAEL